MTAARQGALRGGGGLAQVLWALGPLWDVSVGQLLGLSSADTRTLGAREGAARAAQEGRAGTRQCGLRTDGLRRPHSA